MKTYHICLTLSGLMHNNAPPKPIHVVASGRTSFLFMAESYSTVCMYHIFFVDGPLNCCRVFCSLSRVRLFATPWSIQSIEFSRPEYRRVAFPFLQGVFPTQGSNQGLQHCRRILYQLSHKGSPRILEWVNLSLLQWIVPTQKSNQGLLHWRQILCQLGYEESNYTPIKT